jgi:3-hydroxyacyl-CoA dehydrogenase
MVCEAARILEEGRVAGPEEIDAGSVLGLGFPPSRGGLLEWADTLGASEIVRRLRSLDANAMRYQPPRLLADLASRKVGFFQ